jgi:hypothetical protein
MARTVMALNTSARGGELTHTFCTAIELGAAHLHAAVESNDADERTELVALARGEFAIALAMLNERRKLLEPLAPFEALADERTRASIAKLRVIADETCSN